LKLDERKRQILKAIVNEYIETTEPVASNTIIKKYNIDCSSATARNDMVALEKEGYLEKTHSSSGRIPSNKGYKFYVDELLDDNNLNINEVKYINSKLQDTVDEMEDLTKIATSTISEVTHYTTISIEPNATNQLISEIKFVLLGSRMMMAVIITDTGVIKETIIKFDSDVSSEQIETLNALFNKKLKGKPLSIIDKPIEEFIMNEMNYKIDVIKPIIKQLNKTLKQDERVYIQGTKQALDNPEFRENETAKKFLGLIDSKDLIFNLLDGDEDFNVYIGNEVNGLNDFSLITFKNKVGEKDLGTIGILGPTRMDYSKVISVLKYIRKELNSGKLSGKESNSIKSRLLENKEIRLLTDGISNLSENKVEKKTKNTKGKRG
jgi:heat-inducible transcriptional repressor